MFSPFVSRTTEPLCSFGMFGFVRITVKDTLGYWEVIPKMFNIYMDDDKGGPSTRITCDQKKR